MAQGPETKFYNAVNRYIPRDIYRMKNHNPYVGGIPDLWYSGARSDLWVEYKFLPRVPQRGVMSPSRYELTELQLDWLRERYKEGRTTAVVVGCPEGGVILRDLEWESELSVQGFVKRIVSKQDVAKWVIQTTKTG